MADTLKLPPEVPDTIKDELLEAGQSTLSDLLDAFGDGKISLEEAKNIANGTIDTLVQGAVSVLDAATPLPEPMETATDLALQAGGQAVQDAADKVVDDVGGWLDDKIGPNLKRLTRKLHKATARGKVKRVAALEDKLLEHFPDSEIAQTIREARPTEAPLPAEPGT